MNWVDNDIDSRALASERRWRLLAPPLTFVGVFLITYLYGVPLWISGVGGGVGALLEVGVAHVGSKTVVVGIAVDSDNLYWIDRGGRKNKVSLSMITSIRKIPRSNDSRVTLIRNRGKTWGFRVGPKAASELSAPFA